MGSRQSFVGLVLAAVVVLVAVLALVLGPTTAVATAPADGGGNVTVYRASDVDLDDAGDVQAAIAAGSIDPAAEAVVGETLVVSIDSERLAKSMDARAGQTTDRFLDALDGDASFRIAQTNPSVERPRKVAPVGPENVTVHRDGERTYVLVDTGALRLHFRGNEGKRAEIDDGDRFAVTFGYDLDEHEASGPEVALYSVEAEVLTRYRPEPLRPDVVDRAVRVNVAPDDALHARLDLDDRRPTTVQVEPTDRDGYRRLSLDLREVEPGTGYVLELVHDGSVVDRVEGTVLEPRGRVTNATLAEVETDHLVTRSGNRVTETVDDHVAVNATVALSHGGRVEVLDETCERVGSEWVEPGDETRVSIDLWREGKPVRARNLTDGGFVVRSLRDDGSDMVRYDGPWAETTVAMDGEGTVGDFGDGCRPSAVTPGDGSSGSPPSTGDDSVTSSSASTPPTPDGGGAGTDHDGGTGADGGTASPGQPGFSVLGAVAALLGIALARRRR